MKPAKKVSRYGGPDFDAEGVVSIWAAVSPLSRIPDDYFDERYGDDEIPLSRFCEDFGFGWFDHDFMDTNISEGRAASIEKLIGQCSYSSSFLDQAVAQANKLRLEKTQWVTLLFDFKYDPKQTGITKSKYVEFVGSFPYSQDAPSAIPDEDE